MFFFYYYGYLLFWVFLQVFYKRFSEKSVLFDEETRENTWLSVIIYMYKLYMFRGKPVEAWQQAEWLNLEYTFEIIDKQRVNNGYCIVHVGLAKISVPSMLHFDEREKEGDLTQSYDKTPYTNRKFENQRTTHTNATKNFDYTTIADRLRTVSWSYK